MLRAKPQGKQHESENWIQLMFLFKGLKSKHQNARCVSKTMGLVGGGWGERGGNRMQWLSRRMGIHISQATHNNQKRLQPAKWPQERDKKRFVIRISGKQTASNLTRRSFLPGSPLSLITKWSYFCHAPFSATILSFRSPMQLEL